MLKALAPLKDLESRAVEALRDTLSDVDPIHVDAIDREISVDGRHVDIVADITAFGRRHRLVCEVKSSGQPRHVRNAVLQLRNYLAHIPSSRDATPVLITTYLSAEAQAMCREADVGFLDLEGNVRIVFDGIFIERSVSTKPSVQRRDLKSIFKPKSAQILRTMLRDPSREWRVADLAEAANVSLGQVSNVRTSLLDREWAELSDGGLYLRAPNRVLDAWRDAYEPPSGEKRLFYTILQGKQFDIVAKEAIHPNDHRDAHGARAIFASFSAARWLSPYVRSNMQHFYADDAGLQLLKSGLKLKSASKGENVAITVTYDEGVFLDIVEPVPGVLCTSPVQTYLDLAAAGERGLEAAEHLRSEKLAWPR